MALNVKVGLIGVLDMLKFKNMAKVREQAIQAAPAREIKGEFAINQNAKLLHPDQRGHRTRCRRRQDLCVPVC